MTLKKARVTKNFVLFEGTGVVENLYVRHDHFEDGQYPEEITITLS
jgi:hypothetical protein